MYKLFAFSAQFVGGFAFRFYYIQHLSIQERINVQILVIRKDFRGLFLHWIQVIISFVTLNIILLVFLNDLLDL